MTILDRKLLRDLLRLWPQALALFTWGAVVLMLATLRSSKRLA